MKTKTFSEMVEENCQCCKVFPSGCSDCSERCGTEKWISVGELKQKLQDLLDEFPDWESKNEWTQSVINSYVVWKDEIKTLIEELMKEKEVKV